MKKHLVFFTSIIIVMTIIIACSRNRKSDEKSKKEKEHPENQDDKSKNGKIIYDNPIRIESSNKLIIPLIEEFDDNLLESFKRDYLNSGRTHISNYHLTYNQIVSNNLRNIIFYDLITKDSKFLLDRNVLISKFYFPNKKIDTLKTEFYLFTLIEKDSNKDEKFDNEDAEIVYLSDLEGKNIIQLTSENIQLLKWDMYPDFDMLVLAVKTDSNNDNEFSKDDNVKILTTSISNPSLANELLDKNIIKDKIDEIYNE